MPILNQIMSQAPFLHTQVMPRANPRQFGLPPGVSPPPDPAVLNPSDRHAQDIMRAEQAGAAGPNLQQVKEAHAGGGGLTSQLLQQYGIDPSKLDPGAILRMRHQGLPAAGGVPGAGGGAPAPAQAGYPSGLMGGIMKAFGGGYGSPAGGGIDPAKMMQLIGSFGAGF